jgi:aspartyl-tRNA(Asn)/glutamyl-tRNA(Gln) amidotransferase subunit A
MSGDELGPLHGVPISVKEYISVEGLRRIDANGVDQGVGKRDALSVARLRNAGAVVLGTNTAMGIAQAQFSPYDCQDEARNPWDPGRVTGWSSSGSASAAAAALVPIAVGNDGGGSTRLPAAGAGVVGVHPTPGRIPEVNYEIPTLTGFTGSTGPICRSVRDAAIALGTMAGPDGRDFACMKTEVPDLLEGLDDGVDGMSFAWSDDLGYAQIYAQEDSARVVSAVREAARRLESLGAKVEPVGPISDDFWEDMLTTNYVLQIALATDVPKPSPERWAQALDGRQRTWSSFRKVLASHDLLLTPTMQFLPPTVEDWARAWLADAESYPHGSFIPTDTCFTFIFNWIAFPAVSVPCGRVDGLPVGLQIVGLPGSENKILRAANAFQVAFPETMDCPPIG